MCTLLSLSIHLSRSGCAGTANFRIGGSEDFLHVMWRCSGHPASFSHLIRFFIFRQLAKQLWQTCFPPCRWCQSRAEQQVQWHVGRLLLFLIHWGQMMVEADWGFHIKYPYLWYAGIIRNPPGLLASMFTTTPRYLLKFPSTRFHHLIITITGPLVLHARSNHSRSSLDQVKWNTSNKITSL